MMLTSIVSRYLPEAKVLLITLVSLARLAFVWSMCPSKVKWMPLNARLMKGATTAGLTIPPNIYPSCITLHAEADLSLNAANVALYPTKHKTTIFPSFHMFEV